MGNNVKPGLSPFFVSTWLPNSDSNRCLLATVY